MNNQPPPAGGFGGPSGSQGYPPQQFQHPGKPQFPQQQGQGQPQVKMEFPQQSHPHQQQQMQPLPVKMEYNPANVKMEMGEGSSSSASFNPNHGGPPHHGGGGVIQQGGGGGHGGPPPSHHGGGGGPPPPGMHPGGPMRIGMAPPQHGRPGPYPMGPRPPPQFIQQQMMNRGPMGGGPPPHQQQQLQQGGGGGGGPPPPGMDRGGPLPPPQHHPLPQSAPPPPPGVQQPVLVQMGGGSNEGVLIEKTKLDDLAKEVEPTIVLEEQVKDALLEYTEEFVDELVDRVCRLATHRGNSRLEARDVELVLEQVFSMPRVPRASTFMANPTGSTTGNEKNPGVVAHNQRMALIKRTLKKI